MSILEVLLIVLFPLLFVIALGIGWKIGEFAAKIFFAILDLFDTCKEIN
jgi:hypothetical protein